MLDRAWIRCPYCDKKVLYVDYLVVHGPLYCSLRSGIIEKEGKIKEKKHERH